MYSFGNSCAYVAAGVFKGGKNKPPHAKQNPVKAVVISPQLISLCCIFVSALCAEPGGVCMTYNFLPLALTLPGGLCVCLARSSQTLSLQANLDL